MQGVLERRRQYLRLMRQLSIQKGFFTVSDFQRAADAPRSTAQDWINRLADEGCIIVKRPQSGRTPARYTSRSVIPQSACRRIFTTVDGDMVEIFHECMSSACAAFCGHHHALAGGPLCAVRRDGTLLRECAHVGEIPVTIGSFPESAVGIGGIRLEGGQVVQKIRSIGGPAYSLSDMMSYADGVLDIRVERKGTVLEGEIYTRALAHLVFGIDDTDAAGEGATFALAIALLQYLSGIYGVYPIGHHIVMLYPEVPERTAGNSCSIVEVAAPPELTAELAEKGAAFVSDEAYSSEWGMAIKKGFRIPDTLRIYGLAARSRMVTADLAEKTACENAVILKGGKGRIGALAAVALSGLPNEVLLDPSRDTPLSEEWHREVKH